VRIARLGNTGTRTALVLVLAFLAAACSKAGPGALGSLADIGRRPHTTIGALVFSPPRDATEVSPKEPVMVATKFSDAHLTRVTLTRDGGEAIAGSLTAEGFIATGSLQPDARYTVTATASLPADSSSSSSSSSSSPSGTPNEQTETIRFGTATTPKIVSVTPTVVGPGDPAVVTLDRAAKDVKVEGPATAQLGSGGTTISLYPQGYRPGASFPVSMTVTSMAGVTGGPQSTRFAAKGGPTLTTSFNDGDRNLGVGNPLIVGTGRAPADPADFAAHFSVTADVTAAVPPSAPPAAPVTPTTQPNPCFQYTAPAVTTFDVTATWLSPTRMQLKPRTPDGYWPPNATISVAGNVEGLLTQDGGAYGEPLHRSFSTGDKRVIDVDLSSQTVTACRNGALATQFPVSTGIHGKDTHTGSYYIYQRIPDAEMKSSESEFAPDYYDVKHVPWTQYFHNGEALHGAYWHNNFGRPMSHGCVNISTPTRNASWPNAAPNAEYLWHFDNVGDPVVVHGSTP
jgi:lipoprotein-anchoring transpeptidase ErfK/SrfK